MYTFIGHENWNKPWPNDIELSTENYNMVLSNDNETTVIILRGCMWFYETQKTTLGDIRKHFTEHAIRQLIHDKFIEIIK